MNKLTLVRHAHPDVPDWIIVEEGVPLGTEYMLLGYAVDLELSDPYFGTVITDAYFVCRSERRTGDEPGYLPTFLFRVKES